MKNRNKKSGWYNQSIRHRLSALGISTTAKYHKNKEEIPPKELYIGVEGDKWRYEDGKKAIKLFWWCSHYNKWEWFPFEDFFTDAENIIWNRFVNLIDALLGGIIDNKHLSNHEEEEEIYKEIYENDWEDFNDEEQSIITDMVEKEMIERDFLPVFLKLKYNNPEKWSLEKKITFTDKLIHLEHSTGNLWEVEDMDKFRQEFEEEYL